MVLGGQRHAPAVLSPGNPDTRCIGGWVGYRPGVDGYGKSRLLRSPRYMNNYFGCSSLVEGLENVAVPVCRCFLQGQNRY